MTAFLLSDAHLFQTYLEWYDSVADFERAVRDCADKGAEAYVLAGDIFDYKTTNTTYLRHYQGEEHLVRLRELFRSLETPVYALRGNHEKQVVLESLEQSVENFHYEPRRQWITVGDRDLLLLDTHYRTEGYRDEIIDVFAEVAAEAEDRPGSVLVMHETVGGLDTALPDGALDAVSSSFDQVLNGHMHHLERGAGGFENVVNLPSLLPSRLVRGSYWTEQYRWADGETTHDVQESPFGYVSVEDGNDATVHRFEPSRTVVEIAMDLSGLSISEARKRFKEVLAGLNARADRDDLLVYPEVRGEIPFSPILLADVADEFDDLFITDIKSDATEKVPPELEGTAPATSIVSGEDLQEVVLDAVPDIVAQLEEAGVETDRESVTRVVEYVTGEDADVFESSNPPRVIDGLRRFVEENTDAVDGELPENFETHLTGVAEDVKQ
jgi:DNA repair exonuclease SbcCD nuclease subunit